jgi:hypothetical protein
MICSSRFDFTALLWRKHYYLPKRRQLFTHLHRVTSHKTCSFGNAASKSRISQRHFSWKFPGRLTAFILVQRRRRWISGVTILTGKNRKHFEEDLCPVPFWRPHTSHGLSRVRIWAVAKFIWIIAEYSGLATRTLRLHCEEWRVRDVSASRPGSIQTFDYAKTACVCQCTSDVTAIMALQEVKSYSEFPRGTSSAPICALTVGKNVPLSNVFVSDCSRITTEVILNDEAFYNRSHLWRPSLTDRTEFSSKANSGRSLQHTHLQW